MLNRPADLMGKEEPTGSLVADSHCSPTAFARSTAVYAGKLTRGACICRRDTVLLKCSAASDEVLATHTTRLSPHSFRVTTITDLLEQGIPLEDVQRLAGHADPRTTRLYDRRQKKITRNIVERISI